MRVLILAPGEETRIKGEYPHLAIPLIVKENGHEPVLLHGLSLDGAIRSVDGFSNALIVESTIPDIFYGAIAMKAIDKEIPVLCLSSAEGLHKNTLEHKLVMWKEYKPTTLTEIVSSFLKETDKYYEGRIKNERC